MFACLNTLDVPVHVNLLRGDLLEVDTVLTFQVNASVGVSHERVAGYCQALLGDGDTFKRLPAELCDQLSAWREALYVNPSFVQPSSGAPAEVYTRFEAELHDASEFGAAVMHTFRACSVTRFDIVGPEFAQPGNRQFQTLAHGERPFELRDAVALQEVLAEFRTGYPQVDFYFLPDAFGRDQVRKLLVGTACKAAEN